MSNGCQAEVWREYQGTKLWRFPNSDGYFYVVNHLKIDADGAPNAYHPEDRGIDALKNAGYPHGGWKNVLVADPHDHSTPYLQASGDFAGYYLSMTTLQDPRLPDTDPRRYVDASKVPYVVFPATFYNLQGTGGFGDLALARRIADGRTTPAIVADMGPSHATLGEVSIALAERLGGAHVNPRNGKGAPGGPFVFLVFAKSHADPKWPVSDEQMEARTSDALAAIGGWDRIMDCVNRQ
jgi:hypothetical protein